MSSCNFEVPKVPPLDCASFTCQTRVQSVKIYKAPTDELGYVCYESIDGKALLKNAQGDELTLLYPAGTGNPITIGDVAVIK